LRGYKIATIENLGATQDEFEAIDLSENEITRLENFPQLAKLRTLLLSNNRISKIEPGVGEHLPLLNTIIAANNKIVALKDLDPLADFSQLSHLSLVGNPVCKSENYRLYLIHKLPKITVLDYQKVKPKERDEAKRVFGSLASEAKKDAKGKPIPAAAGASGAAPAESKSEDQEMTQAPAAIDKEQILEQIRNAKTLEEVEKLEKLLASASRRQ